MNSFTVSVFLLTLTMTNHVSDHPQQNQMPVLSKQYRCVKPLKSKKIKKV